MTPVLATLHPSAVVDALHLQCSASVKAQNKLKQQQSEKEAVEQKEDKASKRAGQKGSSGVKVKEVPVKSKVTAEESCSQRSKTSQLQLMFSLSRVRPDVAF